MATPLRTRSDWLAAHPADPARLTLTLSGVAQRSLRQGDFDHAVREFLDEFALRGDHPRACRLFASACRHGDCRYDSYLGALAEHLATARGLTRPGWSLEPGRFLDRFWFVSDVPGFRAISIAQAPAAFRRRGVFLPERSLHRV